MRGLAAVVGMCTLLAGCGGHAAAAGGSNQPPESGPHVVSGGPPNAYIEFGRPGRWMMQGSSCWQIGDSERCADGVPAGQMVGVPVLRVRRGSTGRIHLAFAPSGVQLSLGGRKVPAPTDRMVAFSATHAGLVELFVNHGHDDVEYFARLAFTNG
jgi:hypothetical protein